MSSRLIDHSEYAFIFDMDGTLVDNMGFHAKSWAALFEEHGITENADEFLHKTAGKTFWETLPQVFGDISMDRMLELTRWKEDVYQKLFEPHRKLIAGLDAFLVRASELGIKMAVATAASPRNVDFILDGLAIRNTFGAVVTSADVSNGKPDPEIFLKSAERLGVKPAFCIVFEDAFGGFTAADRAGMKSIGIASVHTVDEIRANSNVIAAAKDFSSFRPEELIDLIS